MHKIVLSALAGAVFSCASAGSAVALNARTWVSGAGVDQASCGPIGSPCRTLQFAHDQTNAGGEINFKDSAGYGAVVITKSINVIADGVLAGALAAPGGNAITINAGASDTVILRGLTIEGAGVGANGVVFNSGGSLDIANCVVQNFSGDGAVSGYGILSQPKSGSPSIIVSNTVTSHNKSVGLAHLPPSGTASTTITLDHVTASGNGDGFIIDGANTSGSTTAALINVLAARNSGNGILLNGSRTTGTIGSSSVLNNDLFGIAVLDGANLATFGNNQIAGNARGPFIGNLSQSGLF